MEKDLKVLEEAVRSGNRLMFKKLCEENNYDESDVQKLCHNMGMKLINKLKSQGRIQDIDSLENQIAEREAKQDGRD